MELEFYKKIIRGESINSIFIAATKPLTLLNAFVLLKLLSLHDFGIYNLIFSFQAMVSGFSINFLDSLVQNEMNVYHGKKLLGQAGKIFKEYAFIKIGIGFLLTIGVYLLADSIGLRYGADTGNWIRIISFIFIVENIHSLVIIALEYQLNFLLSASYDLFYEIIKLVLILIVFRYQTLSVDTLLVLTVCTHLLIIPFLLPTVWRNLAGKNEGELTIPETQSLLFYLVKKYGSLAIARYYLLNFTQNIRPWLVKFYVGIEGVAIFSVAQNFLGALKGMISFNSLKIFLPRELENEQKLRDLFVRGGRYVTYTFAAIFIVGVIVVPLLVNWLVPKYNPSLPYFFVLMTSMLFFGVQSITGQILYSLRKQKELFLIAAVGGMSIAITNAILTPTLQLYGVSLEFFITQLLMTATAYHFLLREKPNFRLSLSELLTLDHYDKQLIARFFSSIRIRLRGTV